MHGRGIFTWTDGLIYEVHVHVHVYAGFHTGYLVGREEVCGAEYETSFLGGKLRNLSCTWMYMYMNMNMCMSMCANHIHVRM